MKLQVDDVDPGAVEVAHQARQLARPILGWRRDPSLRRIHVDLAGEVTAGDFGRPRQVGILGDCDFDPIPADPVLQLVGGAFRDHTPGVDDRDAVRQLVRLLEVLRGEQDGRALADERADHAPHLAATARVKPRGRLIEKEDRRQQHERGRQIQAATHPARVSLRDPVRGIDQVELHQEFFRAALCIPPGEVIQPADHLEVFEARQVFVDRHVLAGQANLCLDAIRVLDHIETRDRGVAAVGLEQGRENPDRRRLARPVRSEQGQQTPFCDLEVEPIECSNAAIVFHQALGVDSAICGGHP